MQDLQGYKLAHGLKTSEEFFAIPPQPQEQCPRIDLILHAISQEADVAKSIYKEMQRYNASAFMDDFATRADYIRFNLESIDIEALRAEVTKLRAWGQGWKDLATEVIEKEGVNAYKYSNFKQK